MARRLDALAVIGLTAGILVAGCTKAPPEWPPDEKPAGWTPTVYTDAVAVQDPGSPLPDGWWSTAVFYEVHVRSFQDSDGDGQGDLRGLTSRLGYIHDLGATALYLLPIARNSDHYHGYFTVDHRDLDPAYGTFDDFADLVRSAHALGMAVVLDFVGEYSSPEHPFFQDAVDEGGYRDWYLWAGADPGWPNPYFPGSPVWYRPARGDGWYYSMFFGQPAFDYRNDSVKAYMRDTLRFWLNLGADGFRFDTVGTLVVKGSKEQLNLPESHAWFQEVRRDVLDAYQNRFAIAEGGDGSYGAYGPGEFHAEMGVWWGMHIMSALADEDARALGELFLGAWGWGIFTANHDLVKPRALTRFGGSEAKAKLAATALLTAPGIPFVYYGEEVGMRSLADGHVVGLPPPYDDERLRSPMQWDGTDAAGFTTGQPYLGLNEDYAAHNVAQASADPASLLAHYRRLIAVRKATPPLLSPTYNLATTSDPRCCLALERQDGISILLQLFNVCGGARTVTVSLAGTNFSVGRYVAGPDLLGGPTFGDVTHSNFSHYAVKVPAYGAALLTFTPAP
jgi:alpha-amylase